jgi:hypothetical protein
LFGISPAGSDARKTALERSLTLLGISPAGSDARKTALERSLTLLGISPAGSDARKTAQLAEKIRSLYTGELPERIHYLGNQLAAWATIYGGEGAWAGQVFWRSRLLFPFFFYWPDLPDAAAAVPSIP